jgi:hypothetical protein
MKFDNTRFRTCAGLFVGQPPDARLTPKIAHEFCQRTESATVLDGSIASLGSQDANSS